jgi:hypothetical protein
MDVLSLNSRHALSRYCRENGLSPHGTKRELKTRVLQFHQNLRQPPPPPPPPLALTQSSRPLPVLLFSIDRCIDDDKELPPCNFESTPSELEDMMSLYYKLRNDERGLLRTMNEELALYEECLDDIKSSSPSILFSSQKIGNLVRVSVRYARIEKERRQVHSNLNTLLRLIEDKDKKNVEEDVVVNSTWCIICYENPRNTALIPCGHAMLCYQCALKSRSKGCPICRKRIREVMKIYSS